MHCASLFRRISRASYLPASVQAVRLFFAHASVAYFMAAGCLFVILGGCTSMQPPRVLALSGPGEVPIDTAAVFVAQINKRATEHVRLDWDFGDGTTDVGLRAVHRFARSGTFAVRFTATNEAGSATRTHLVRVQPPTASPRIATIQAIPNPVVVGQPVTYQSDVRGVVAERLWSYGDGTEVSDANGEHRYASPGTYTVRLYVANEAGSDTRTVSLTVQPDVPALCRADLETNPVFFAYGTSLLSDSARDALRANAELFATCAPLPIRIEAYAGSSEPRAATLAHDRGRAVAMFYQQQRIDPERLLVNAHIVPAPAGKTRKGGLSLQRVASHLVNE